MAKHIVSLEHDSEHSSSGQVCMIMSELVMPLIRLVHSINFAKISVKNALGAVILGGVTSWH